jgi:hypothetical protein
LFLQVLTNHRVGVLIPRVGWLAFRTFARTFFYA